MAHDDHHEVSRMQDEGGHAHPDEQRVDGELAAAAQPESDPAAMLETFSRTANWSLLHEEDLRRFDDFVAIAKRAGWLSTEVESRLLKLGLPEGLCHSLRRRYFNVAKPMPLAGTDRRQLDEQIKTLNAKLGCGRAS